MPLFGIGLYANSLVEQKKPRQRNQNDLRFLHLKDNELKLNIFPSRHFVTIHISVE